MKKTTWLLFSLLIYTSFVSANCGTYEGCPQEGLRSYTNPCGFYIGLTGTYAVPSETGLGTFTDTWLYADSDGGVTGLSKPSKADYDGAGAIEVGYDFGCSANNIEVEYFRLYNSKHNFNDTSDNPIGFGSAFFNLGVPIASGEVFVSDADLKYTQNQVDVKVGHRFITGSGCLQLRPSIGVRYLDLEHDLTFAVGHVRSRYCGAGPMIAFDASYKICRGFSFLGRFDSSVLMGSVKGDSLLNFGSITRFKSPSTDRVVSSFGGRLGIAYDYLFCNQSSVKLEVGYQAGVYIGPFDVITGFAAEAVPRISNLGTTNFANSGPYLKLTWHM